MDQLKHKFNKLGSGKLETDSDFMISISSSSPRSIKSNNSKTIKSVNIQENFDQYCGKIEKVNIP